MLALPSVFGTTIIISTIITKVTKNVYTNNNIETAVKSLYVDMPVYWTLGLQN